MFNYEKDSLLQFMERNIADDFRTLKANITGKSPASEKTMANKIDRLEERFSDYKEALIKICMVNEAELKEEIHKLKSLSKESLEVYNLYESLMDLYDFDKDILNLQKIRSIGNIVSSFASKEKQEEENEESPAATKQQD